MGESSVWLDEMILELFRGRNNPLIIADWIAPVRVAPDDVPLVGKDPRKPFRDAQDVAPGFRAIGTGKLPPRAAGPGPLVFHVPVRTVDELWLSAMLYPRRILLQAYEPASPALTGIRAVDSSCQTAPTASRVRL